MRQGCFLAIGVLGLGFLLASCGGGTGGGGGSPSGDTSGDNSNPSNYSSIHYANGNGVLKSQWLSMYDDHKLTGICNSGQSYYDDQCWDNVSIDADNLNLSVSKNNGTSENIILSGNVDSKLYNATTSKFNSGTKDDLCLRATTEFLPDDSRALRDGSFGTEGECWYKSTYDMPWPFRPMYSTLPNSASLTYMDIQTFIRYGDGNPYSSGTPYVNNWWLNGTLKVNGKIFQLSTVTMSDLETAFGTNLSTRYYSLNVGNYNVLFIFDKDYSNPYMSIAYSSSDKVDQSQKSTMRPVIVTFTRN